MSHGDNVLVVPKGTGADQAVYLINYGVNESYLKQEHIEALDRYVVPILALGGYAVVVGMASRSGSPGNNQSLSQRRARGVLNFMYQKPGISQEKLKEVTIGVGEIPAAMDGVADGTEDPSYRSVWVAVGLTSVPPPPPPPPPANSSRKYSCTNKTFDRDFYDRVNGADHWIFEGASGNHASLRQIRRTAKTEYELGLNNNYRSSFDEVLLGFYNSYIFQTWYVDGMCGLESLKDVDHAMMYLASYNTAAGQKKKGGILRAAGSFFK